MSSLCTPLAEHSVAMICALTIHQPLQAAGRFTLWRKLAHYLQQQIPLIIVLCAQAANGDCIYYNEIYILSTLECFKTPGLFSFPQTGTGGTWLLLFSSQCPVGITGT